MKTVLIYDQCGEASIEFYILDGDYQHLDRVYINGAEEEQEKQDELSALLYDNKSQKKLKARMTFPTNAVIDGAAVIVAGFLP